MTGEWLGVMCVGALGGCVGVLGSVLINRSVRVGAAVGAGLGLLGGFGLWG